MSKIVVKLKFSLYFQVEYGNKIYLFFCSGVYYVNM